MPNAMRYKMKVAGYWYEFRTMQDAEQARAWIYRTHGRSSGIDIEPIDGETLESAILENGKPIREYFGMRARDEKGRATVSASITLAIAIPLVLFLAYAIASLWPLLAQL